MQLYKAILNKMKRQTESGRTLTLKINHNRSTALERSAKITGFGGGGGGVCVWGGWFKPVLR